MADGWSVVIKGSGLDSLQAMAEVYSANVHREVEIVLNTVAKGHAKKIGSKIRQFVNINKKGTDETVFVTKKASKASLSAEIRVSKTKRPSLKRFGLKQLAKGGVSYKINKTGPRRKIDRGFGPTMPRLGHHGFVRVGKPRLPIAKLHGISAWAVYVKNELDAWSQQEISERMEKAVVRRINGMEARADRIARAKAGRR